MRYFKRSYAGNGGDNRDRTGDLLHAKQTLSQLSYIPTLLLGKPLNRMERVTGIEPALVAWEATVLPLNYTRDSVSILL